MGGKVGDVLNIATLGTYKGLGVDKVFEPAKPDYSAVSRNARQELIGRASDTPSQLKPAQPRRNVSESSPVPTLRTGSSLLTTKE